MEKLGPTQGETQNSESLRSQIKKLLNVKTTVDDVKSYWKDKEFAYNLPNMVYLLLKNPQYTQEQKQRIFELGFRSFIAISWAPKDNKIVSPAIRMKVNEQTKLWEDSRLRGAKPDTESLIMVEMGSFLLLGLSLKDKENVTNEIIETYKNSGKETKSTRFRDNIIRLILTNSAFRQWVKENKLDTDNGFEWDVAVPNLSLSLFPLGKLATDHKMPQKLPPELLTDLTNYPPSVIATFVDYVLSLSTKQSPPLRSDINTFRTYLAERLKSGDFDGNPNLRRQIEQKLEL